MRICVATLGSRGDVQPYLALADRLRREGHDVVLAGPEDFQAQANEYQIPYHLLAGSFRSILGGAGGQQLMGASTNFFQTMRAMNTLMKETRPMMERLSVALYEAAQGADVLVHHLGITPYALSIGEKTGVKLINSAPSPLYPTSELPNLMFPQLPFNSSLYNRITGNLFPRLMWQFFGNLINKFRRETLHLPPQSYREYKPALLSMPMVFAYSEHVVPRPADWPANVQVCGYWTLPDKTDWQPPAELLRFLDAGDPPVYIGFGSMSGRNPQATTEIVLKALALSKQRAVLLTGWGGLDTSKLPETVYPINHISHQWLMPRMAAIVHHGGAGTTGAALQSGKPSMVVAFGADQPFWGKRTAELGVGASPLLFKKLNAEKLAALIRQMVTDKGMQQRAAQLGSRLQQEDGLARAVEIITAA